MRGLIIGALGAFLLALPAASAVGADAGAAEAARLKDETRRLRAELAKSRAEIRELQRRLADAQAAMRRVEAQVARALAQTTRPAPTTRPGGALEIRVEDGGWGGAGTRDIQKVLLSTAGELWKHFPDRRLAPIVVRHSSRGPITLFRRGGGGEHVVKLDVEGTFWCQFAYQFAHEFCHILTNYSERAPREHQWLVESLCEAASVYAIGRMSESWKTAPPYPNWKGYSGALAKYAENLRKKKSEEVPAGETLADWYRKNAPELRKSPYQRDKNRLVARHLLGLLEKSPEHWRAVGYLNHREPDASKGFAGFLSAWRDESPKRHKPFVEAVAGLFAVKL